MDLSLSLLKECYGRSTRGKGQTTAEIPVSRSEIIHDDQTIQDNLPLGRKSIKTLINKLAGGKSTHRSMTVSGYLTGDKKLSPSKSADLTTRHTPMTSSAEDRSSPVEIEHEFNGVDIFCRRGASFGCFQETTEPPQRTVAGAAGRSLKNM